ncbi:unnamed protein product [Rhodiola kirilowii]
MVASEAPDGRSEARNNNLYHELRDKMAELSKTKAEIQRAKDSATQSWLDSRPMIDELEKLQLQLESARKRVTETENIISHLQMELESVHSQIRDMNEGGREANKTISETNQALDQLRDDMEELKEAADEEKRMRKKLKQTLRVKRQELRKVQLTLRAVRMETEGYTVSEGEALQHVNRLEKENSTVQLSVEDYAALTKRAKEETSLGDWRVLISVEQRVVAEAAREAAVKRLKEFYSEQRSKNKVAEEDEHVRQEMLPEDDEHVAKIPRSVSTRTSSVNASSRRTDVPSQESGLRQHQRVGGKRRNVPQKKKTSIFYKIRRFFVLKITRLFK